MSLSYLVLFEKSSTTSDNNTFTSKDIAMIVSSWSHGWHELAQVLKIQSNTKTIAEQPNDEDKCISILQEWIQKMAKDRGDLDIREELAELFQENEYYSMSSVVYDL